MAKLSLNKAAKEAGIAKTTLLDALKSGRVSGNKNAKGHWEIDTSELFRVYPKTSQEPDEKPKPTSQENDIKTSVLEAELKITQQRFEDAEKTIEDLRRRLDEETTERRENQRMLTHMQGQQPQGFFKRLFG